MDLVSVKTSLTVSGKYKLVECLNTEIEKLYSQYAYVYE